MVQYLHLRILKFPLKHWVYHNSNIGYVYICIYVYCIYHKPWNHIQSHPGGMNIHTSLIDVCTKWQKRSRRPNSRKAGALLKSIASLHILQLAFQNLLLCRHTWHLHQSSQSIHCRAWIGIMIIWHKTASWTGTDVRPSGTTNVAPSPSGVSNEYFLLCVWQIIGFKSL